MIDEALDMELEARLRAALNEMIPKLLASAPVVSRPDALGVPEIVVARRAMPARRSRRVLGAVLAISAMILGLIVVAARDTPRRLSPAAVAGPPPWYDLIRPSLPERFSLVALTLVTDAQLWFVALNPTDGKALEIQLASGGYSTEATTAVDATGEWVETAQGWSVRTPTGLFVSVSCNIGVGGRDFVGAENYCDMTSGVAAFTRDEIRAVANSLATSLSPSIFDEALGTPSGDSIDASAATALISDAVPGAAISASDLGNGSDHIYNVGVEATSTSDTLPPVDASVQRANTSVRILHDIYPSTGVTGEEAAALYDDAAVVWLLGSGGVAVRISTTDPSPESVIRLEQLAHDLMQLDPNATNPAPATPIPTATATTTTAEYASSLDTATATTLAPCGQSTSSATALVINASHSDGTAAWWKDLLAANVPTVHFAPPVNATDQETTSRVLAVAGYECEAALVRKFTSAVAVEAATVEMLQSLVPQPLPAGTSIVVIVGDDVMAHFTTGVTTTSYG